MSFADEKNGYAACGADFRTTNQIYRTTDGGRRWKRVHELPEGTALTGLHAVDADTVLACAHRQGQGIALRSTDGGATFDTTLEGKGFPQGMIAEGERGFLVGAHGFVARTDDAGTTWKPLASGTRDTALAASARDGVLYLAGMKGIVHRMEVGAPGSRTPAEAPPARPTSTAARDPRNAANPRPRRPLPPPAPAPSARRLFTRAGDERVPGRDPGAGGRA